jgi:hypothetical protein
MSRANRTISPEIVIYYLLARFGGPQGCSHPRGDAIAASQIGDFVPHLNLAIPATIATEGSRVRRTVQLSIADAGYAAALREALTSTGAWHVEMVDRPDPAIPCVLVLDESSFERLSLPLANPERVVLISQQDPRLLARAWDASIVSVVSRDDSLPTVLLAIMAAALRVGKIASSALVPA